MKTLFISCPHWAPTSLGKWENQKHAVRVSLEAMDKGWRPIIPHLIYRHAERKYGWGFVMEQCREWIHDSDAVLFTGDWIEARGCRFEHDFAIAAGVPRYYSLKQLPDESNPRDKMGVEGIDAA